MWEDIAIWGCLVTALLAALWTSAWRRRVDEYWIERGAKAEACKEALQALQARSGLRASEGSGDSFLLGHDDALEALAEVARDNGLKIKFTNEAEG